MKKQTSVSVDENFLREANKVFGTLGISLSEAVNLFLEKVSVEKDIPFELNSPSDELLRRIDMVESKKDLTEYQSLNKLFDDLQI